MWVDGPDGTPYRPWGGVWVSLETGVVNMKIAEADDGDASLALANRHLPGYLSGDSEWTDATPGSYAMGSREEAVICVDELGDAWKATPGALEWLATHAPAGKRRKRHRR
jgi:hypothetical protein